MFVQHVPVWVKEELFNGKKLTEIINTKHENIKYLPGCIIPYNVVCSVTPRLSNLLTEWHVYIAASRTVHYTTS